MGKAHSQQRVVSTRYVNQQLAKNITEKVARRVQELEGRYGSPAGFDMKAAIYDEVLEAIEAGIEC